MSKKNAPLISRPEPPSVDKIIEDIGSAQKTDVVFTLASFPNNGELCSDSVNDSQTSNDTSVATTPDTKQGPDVDQVYTEAKQLIGLTEELKTAPEKMSNQCERLETLAQELTESINALKQQARSVPARTGS